MQDNAKKYKENLENGRADIMGFGAGGYWSQNGKTYGEKNPADAHAYAKGTGGVSDYDKGLQHAMGGTATNPVDAHKYAQGTGGVSDYNAGMSHALGGSGKPNPAEAHKYARGTGGVSDYNKGMQHALGVNKKADRPNAALGAKEQQINQKQDEVVHGQNLSDTKKYKLNDELRDLQAEKNVITWQQQNPQATSEDFDSKKDYYNEMINRAADDYLNEWGGKDTAEAKEAFAEYSEKVHGIVAQRDAYNRAKMGVDTSTTQKS